MVSDKRLPLFGAVLALLLAAPLCADPPVLEATLLGSFDTFDARQGVAVDAGHFYAVNNTRITRHDRHTGEPQLQFDGGEEGEAGLIHLDSALVFDGKLYAAHSNYPHWPMTSSIEVWDAETLEHVTSHSFGIGLGSMTWLDRHQERWWGAFGNYDKVQAGQPQAYGTTAATQLVELDDAFRIVRRWVFPDALLRRFTPMSNSGGSWGPDGLLYITGHDHPELYVLRLPAIGSELEWVATVHMPGIEGQGIAWDRSADGRELWGILKAERQVLHYNMPEIPLPVEAGSRVRTEETFARD